MTSAPHGSAGDHDEPEWSLEQTSPGWLLVLRNGEPAMALGCHRNEDGRLAFDALQALPGCSLGTRALRELPLGRLESAAQALPPAVELEQERQESVKSFWLDLFRERWAQQPEARHIVEVRMTSRVPVRRPEGGLTAEFLSSVASAYRDLAPRTNAPTKRIAEEAQVPLSTARRWVSQARREGLLGPGARGKALS